LSTPARQSLPSHAKPVSPARVQTVEAARQVWIKKLIDLSRRNNLLYFRPLKTGTLEFSSPAPERLRDLLAGESVAASKLAPEIEDEVLNKSLRDIQRRALANLEEKGLSTLFVAFGVATWPAPDSGRPIDKRDKYQHSLKALAIREKKIHIVGSPAVKIEGTPVYLDVEGVPDRDFYSPHRCADWKWCLGCTTQSLGG
jgi:hypothetical protein